MSTVWLYFAISLAGGLGAVCRYACDTFIAQKSVLPIATILVNISGSALAGFVAGLAGQSLPEGVSMILMTGFLGGYTTFSTASLQTAQLLRQRKWKAATFTLFGQVIVCVIAAALGLLVALEVFSGG